MTTIRVALGVGMLMLALSSGCIDNSVTTAPSTPAVKQGVTPGPTPVATVSLAKPKSILPPKPIDPASTDGPRLAIDADTVDFGNIPYSEAVVFSFNIKNVGLAPLTIGPAFIRVIEGCWPPNVVVGATTLTPGQTTYARLAFGMHEGMGGPHLFEVVIPSNDPVEPEKVSLIRAIWPLP